MLENPKIIAGSVGRFARNGVKDVETVVALLDRVPANFGGPPQGWDSSSPAARLMAIRSFQLFHFGAWTERIEPGGLTVSKLYELANGSPAPGLPRALPREFMVGVMSALRDEIVNVAAQEATGPNRVTGVSQVPDPANPDEYLSKQTATGAATLEKYFKAFSNPEMLQAADYFDGLPQGIRWCGVFAAWVFNEATTRLSQDFRVLFKWAKSIQKVVGTRLEEFTFFQDGFQEGIEAKPASPLPTTKVTYMKGDVCLVKEQSVVEDFPSHHFIVAEDPYVALAEGREMNTIEGNYPDGGVGKKHSVTRHKRAVMNYAYYQILRPAPL